MRVKFINVGRNKRSWDAETEKVDYDWLYKQVKSNGTLMSSNIEFSDEGTIFAGMYNVGKFEIEGGAAHDTAVHINNKL